MKHSWKNEWDKILSNPKPGFIPEVSPTLIQAIKLRGHNTGIALDIGAGRGQHTAYLLQHGYKVDALDFSQESMKKIEREQKSYKAQLHLEQTDVRTFKLAKMYDMIVCISMLHYIKKRDRIALIKGLQKHTTPGGYHVIIDPIHPKEISHQHTPSGNIFFMKRGELGEMYKDWIIRSYRYQPQRKDGRISKKLYWQELLIARKP